jgi:hypothetical protein
LFVATSPLGGEHRGFVEQLSRTLKTQAGTWKAGR